MSCVPNSSLPITRQDTRVGQWLFACVHHLCPSSCFPVSNDLIHDFFQMYLHFYLSHFYVYFHLSSNTLHSLHLPSRWVHAAAVRWPSCPQCLEPVGFCWWGWLCPRTTGWSWWRASSCSRTRAWRWRWRCIQASGEFALWLVGRYIYLFKNSHWQIKIITVENWYMCTYWDTNTHPNNTAAVCGHMSTSS